MQTAGDPDKDKIQRRGKKVGTTTHAYWVVAGDELTCVTMEEVCQYWNIDKLIFTNGMQVLRWVSAVERENFWNFMAGSRSSTGTRQSGR
jgi:hypothetical protein